MDQYIRYHRKPYAKYLDVQSFNAKYGTNIKEVEDFDLYFHYTFTTNRNKQGPDDFLMANFMNHDQFIEFMATKKGKGEKKENKGKDRKGKEKELGRFGSYSRRSKTICKGQN